jgi:hypothetical protein
VLAHATNDDQNHMPVPGYLFHPPFFIPARNYFVSLSRILFSKAH